MRLGALRLFNLVWTPSASCSLPAHYDRDGTVKLFEDGRVSVGDVLERAQFPGSPSGSRRLFGVKCGARDTSELGENLRRRQRQKVKREAKHDDDLHRAPPPCLDVFAIVPIAPDFEHRQRPKTLQ